MMVVLVGMMVLLVGMMLMMMAVDVSWKLDIFVSVHYWWRMTPGLMVRWSGCPTSSRRRRWSTAG